MSSKDKIETVTNELDATVERKAAGLEDSLAKSVLNFNELSKRSSTSSTRDSTYEDLYRDTAKKSHKSNFGKSEERSMDNNKLLEMYIDKVDRDQRDLKEDIRESERRTQKRMEDSNKRIDEKMNQIAEMIREQNKKIENINSKIDYVSKDVSKDLNEYRKFMWGITVSIFLGIAAMVLTLIMA